eukprot:14918096-Alexandrium_andersonii.AAC.1
MPSLVGRQPRWDSSSVRARSTRCSVRPSARAACARLSRAVRRCRVAGPGTKSIGRCLLYTSPSPRD